MVESALDFFSTLCIHVLCLCFSCSVSHMSWCSAYQLFGECYDIVLQKFVLFRKNLGYHHIYVI